MSTEVQTIKNAPLSINFRVLYVGVLNGRIVVSDKEFLEELDCDGALAHTTITHHHQLHLWL